MPQVSTFRCVGARMSASRWFALAGLALGIGATPALAAEPLPQPGCQGLTFEDEAGDQGNTTVPKQSQTDSTDILGGFLLTDPVTGKTTINVVVKDLELTVPPPFTTITWNGYVTPPGGASSFVRAQLDATGSVVYEWGAPDSTLPVTRNVYQGDTTGHMFTGPNGVVQITLPPSLAPADAVLDTVYASSWQAATSAPNAFPPTVSRGLTEQMDTTDPGEYHVSSTWCPAPGSTDEG